MMNVNSVSIRSLRVSVVLSDSAFQSLVSPAAIPFYTFLPRWPHPY